MTRDELEAALEWADALSNVKNPEPSFFIVKDVGQKYAPTLASALRDAWAEIDRLKAKRPHYGGWIEYLGVGHYQLHIEPPAPDMLDEALNSGDGSYKP